MSKKFFCFFITLLLGMMAACSNNQPANNTPSANNTPNVEVRDVMPPAVANTKPAQPVNTANLPPGVKPLTPEEMTQKGFEKVADKSVTFPTDIPTFPNAEITGKRVNEEKTIFDFKVKAGLRDVLQFYAREMKGKQWEPQPAPIADGLHFQKDSRYVQVLPIQLGDTCEIHVFIKNVTQPSQLALNKDTAATIYAGNLRDVSKVPTVLPKDVPIYPNSKVKPRSMDTPRYYFMYGSTDPVTSIASWYGAKMKEQGWSVHNDTSEMGDSMVIYRKEEKGVVRHIAARVNDLKDERLLTLITYPDNATIPIVDPVSKVSGAPQAQAAMEAIKKAMKDKDTIERNRKAREGVK